MCQLFYCNYPNVKVFKNIAAQIATILSVDGHHLDGFGLLNDNGTYWKTEKGAGHINNLYEVFREIFNSRKSFAMHVRKASPGIEVLKKNAHPFSAEKYILMHNGRVYSSLIKEKESDSYRFLLELDKSEEETPLAIKNTYEKSFTGKFAFIIFNKKEQKFYIARGKTAKLNIVKFRLNNKDGYFIVTEPTSAKFIISILSNNFKNKIVFYTENDRIINELKEETIYRCDEEPVKIEKIQEKQPVAKKQSLMEKIKNFLSLKFNFKLCK